MANASTHSAPLCPDVSGTHSWSTTSYSTWMTPWKPFNPAVITRVSETMCVKWLIVPPCLVLRTSPASCSHQNPWPCQSPKYYKITYAMLHVWPFSPASTSPGEQTLPTFTDPFPCSVWEQFLGDHLPLHSWGLVPERSRGRHQKRWCAFWIYYVIGIWGVQRWKHPLSLRWRLDISETA